MGALGRVRDHFDWTLFISVAALAVIGVINLYSATSVARGTHSEDYIQQIYWLVGGGILFLVAEAYYRHCVIDNADWDAVDRIMAMRGDTIGDRLGVAKGFEALVRLHRKLRLPSEDYKRLLNFLVRHGCAVDFRPYRPGRPKAAGAPFGSMLRTEARLRSFALKPMIQPV